MGEEALSEFYKIPADEIIDRRMAEMMRNAANVILRYSAGMPSETNPPRNEDVPTTVASSKASFQSISLCFCE